MKQPIAGIAGLKPRAPGPKPDGRLSKAESRALDREYRIRRNEALELKNRREIILLAKARGELILRDLVERQAAYLLIAMRQRMLDVPRAYAGRLVGLADAHEASQVLRQAMIECLAELQDLRGQGDRRELARTRCGGASGAPGVGGKASGDQKTPAAAVCRLTRGKLRATLPATGFSG